MRRGYNSELIKDEQGQLLGFNLGADYCAEHEWGIDKIKSSFGIDVDSSEKPFAKWWEKILLVTTKSALGVDKRLITKCPELVKGEYKISIKDRKQPKSKPVKHTIYYIGFKIYYYSSAAKEERFEEEIKRGVYSVSETENVWGWWSEGDFMVASTDKQAIEDLYQAFQALDVTISVGGGNVFQNGGLHFVIKSRISQEIIDDVYQKDLDNLNLKKAASSTGIYKKLEKAGKGFYALSPRWKDAEKKEIVFWLNPQEQHANNSGWYTISDLEDWIKGVGKIPKEKVS
jgi:hypothetical protein